MFTSHPSHWGSYCGPWTLRPCSRLKDQSYITSGYSSERTCRNAPRTRKRNPSRLFGIVPLERQSSQFSLLGTSARWSWTN
ncbi:hypothetical protein CC2G_014375 [Coprinopsis cinerea AmutBmut pab1-1]|nr:hypothetical protein CC2G_014375 [Coprinopsis cinerea AmutBmut pab1-1]